MVCVCCINETCPDCCDSFPDEIEVSVSSNTPTVCYQCTTFLFPQQFVCAVSDTFSISGTYTLTKAANPVFNCAVYEHSSCVGNTSVQITVVCRIESRRCRWIVTVFSVGSAVGSPQSSSNACRACDNTFAFLAGGQLTGTQQFDFTKTGDCSITGTAQVAFDVGFDGDFCSTPNVSCLTCEAGTVLPTGCSPASLVCDLTLTV